MIRSDAESPLHSSAVEEILLDRVVDPNPLSHHLQKILVAGNDDDLEAGLACLLRQRCDQVVRLVTGELQNLLGPLVYGDLEFQKKGDSVGRKSFVSKLLTKEVTKIVNVSPLLNHNSIGVCGNLYSLALGSVDNTIRFEGDAAKLAQAVPEIYALPALGDRVVLNIVDALICQYEGEHMGRLHNSVELNQLRFSTDPVALDILSVQEINDQRRRAFTLLAARTNRLDLYHNAALLELGAADPRKIDLENVKPGN